MALQPDQSTVQESVISPLGPVPGGFVDESVSGTPEVQSCQLQARLSNRTPQDMFEDANTATPLPQEISTARQPDQSPVRSLTGGSISQSVETPDTQVVAPLLEQVDTNTQPQTDGAELSPTTSQPLTAPAANRLSTTSLSSVKLGDDENKPASPNGTATPDQADIQAFDKMAATDGVSPKTESEEPRPEVPTRTSGRGWFGSQSTLPTVAPAVPSKDNSNKPQPPLPPPTKRSITGPFSWLSRSSTKEAAPTPRNPSPGTGRERGMTTSSMTTLHSNQDLMINTLDGVAETSNGSARPSRNSLRDRFKLLRLREEAGIVSLGGEDGEAPPVTTVVGRKASMTLGITSPMEMPASPGGADLAPGTAAGVNAGPPAIEEVDWDLWQSVVNEGPVAVARSSPEELNQAIASGIPTAIRGVVWQVIAQSKNEELEAVYRDLLSKGTEQDRDRSSFSSSGPSTFSKKDKDSAASSSASSVHSESSSGVLKPSSSATERDPEIIARNAAAALAQRKKKAKEDAAALLKLEKAIKRDLGARTSFSKFAASAGLQDGLFGVCKAYALFDPDVGYAQGMNFLAMPLLFNMPEEEAFCLLVRLMNQYHLRDLFVHDMPGLHKHLYQFERLLEDFEPALFCHLKRKGVTPHLYATQWFLTLFAYRFPLQLVLRIYDLILSEGLEAILKFGICLMQKNAKALLEISDMMALTNFLKDRLFDVYIDKAPSAGSILESGFFGSSAASIDKEVYRADMLVKDACAVEITPQMIAMYTAEWEEKTKAEKEREAELENLKSTRDALTVKVRKLEERVQEHDQEHASLATELVHTKVQNEELKEANEALTSEVAELKIIVEKQPQEVEDRLSAQMDTLVKRNQEVHQENQKLEEEMAEMEAQLVQTKMAYAEVSQTDVQIRAESCGL